jgi:hypothetical protein
MEDEYKCFSKIEENMEFVKKLNPNYLFLRTLTGRIIGFYLISENRKEVESVLDALTLEENFNLLKMNICYEEMTHTFMGLSIKG